MMEVLKNYLNRTGHSGFIPFAVWMNAALYAPKIGYYTSTLPVGSAAAGADFTTAPELSCVFGHTIARSIAPCLQDLAARGLPVTILECGAGTGALAAAVLDGLAGLGITPAHYNILEISPSLRAQQAQRLVGYPCVRWLDALPASITGIVLANELLDAMPVQAYVAQAGKIYERGVVWQATTSQWQWAQGELAPAHSDALWASLPSETQAAALEGAYQFERGTQAAAWVASAAHNLSRGAGGAMLLIDYGFAAPELYHPQRSGGTLMAHRLHRASTDVLAHACDADITAHVDFSAVAHAAVAGGLSLAGYTNQARFLINAGVGEAFAAHTATATVIEQAHANRALQMLLSEAEMGELFKVIAFTHQCSAPLGFERGDRSHRLLDGLEAGSAHV